MWQRAQMKTGNWLAIGDIAVRIFCQFVWFGTGMARVGKTETIPFSRDVKHSSLMIQNEDERLNIILNTSF